MNTTPAIARRALPLPFCRAARMPRPSALALALAPICLALASCSWGHQDAGLLSRYTVHPGDLDITITAEGMLKSSKPTEVLVKAPGKILFIVAEGTRVAAGDRLLDLENPDISSSLRLTEEDLAAEQRDLENAKLELKLKRLEADKQIGDTETALNAAILADDEYVKGKAPLQEQDLELAVDKAVSEMTDAQEKFARMPLLLAKGFVTVSEKRAAELDLQEKTLAVDHKKRELEIFRLYENPTQKSKVDTDVAAARLARARITDQMATEIAQKQAEVDKLGNQILETQSKLEQLQVQVQGLHLTAPSGGIVVYGDEQMMMQYQGYDISQRLQVGSSLNQQECVMSIPDLTAMEASVLVGEADIARIAPGQVASTEILGQDNRRLSGVVTTIATTPTQQWGDDSKRFQVSVSLAGTSGISFRPGMSVRTEIHLAHLEHVLHVPVEMVLSRGAEHYCWVRTGDGTLAYHELKLGESNDAQVVVASGVQDGDEVVLPETEPALPPQPAAGAPAAAVASSGAQ